MRQATLLALIMFSTTVVACGDQQRPVSDPASTGRAAAHPAGGAPVSRGVYVGRATVQGRRCRGCVLLTVSATRRRFVRSSFLGVEMEAMGVRCSETVHLAGPDRRSPFGLGPVRIDAAGAFRFVTPSRREKLTVAGRFSIDGRRVRGRLIVKDTTRSCAQTIRARFTARLSSRPHAPPREQRPACAPVISLRPGTYAVTDTVEIYGYDPDCAMARDTARHWRADPACQNLTVGATCMAGGRLCTAIDHGEQEPSAQATCGATGQPPIELLQVQECRAPLYLTVGAARLDCRVARDVARTWVRSTCTEADDKGDVCRVPGRTCRLTNVREYAASVDYVSRCRANHDRRQAVAIVWNTG